MVGLSTNRKKVLQFSSFYRLGSLSNDAPNVNQRLSDSQHKSHGLVPHPCPLQATVIPSRSVNHNYLIKTSSVFPTPMDSTYLLIVKRGESNNAKRSWLEVSGRHTGTEKRPRESREGDGHKTKTISLQGKSQSYWKQQQQKK